MNATIRSHTRGCTTSFTPLIWPLQPRQRRFTVPYAHREAVHSIRRLRETGMAIGSRSFFRSNPPCPSFSPPRWHETTGPWAGAIQQVSCGPRIWGHTACVSIAAAYPVEWRQHRRHALRLGCRMKQADTFTLNPQWCDQRPCEHRPAVFRTLALPGGDLQPLKIHILDPHSQRLLQAQAEAVHQTRAQPVHTIRPVQFSRVAHVVKHDEVTNLVNVSLHRTQTVVLATAPLSARIEQRGLTGRCHGHVSSLGDCSVCRDQPSKDKRLRERPRNYTSKSTCADSTIPPPIFS